MELDFGGTHANKGFVAINSFGGKLNGGDFQLDTSGKSQHGIEILWDKDSGYGLGELRGISVAMNNCTLYQPLVYSVLFSGNLNLAGRFDSPIITGNVVVNRGEYTQPLDSFMQKLFSSRQIGFKAFFDYPLIQDLEMDVNVQVPGNLKMVNSVIDVETRAAARVRGSLVDPIVIAQGNIVAGEFTYLGRKFTITRGTIRNKAEIDPEYDITAETKIEGTDSNNNTTFFTVQMEIRGSLTEHLPPTFKILGGGVTQDQPNLSEEEIMAILALGSTPQEFLAKALSTSSPQLLAKWYLESQAEKRLKLKQFQIDIDPENSKETRLVMARQLMDQMSVLIDVGFGRLERIGLEYEFSKHFAIAGEINQGEWGLDLKVKRDSPTVSAFFDFLK